MLDSPRIWLKLFLPSSNVITSLCSLNETNYTLGLIYWSCKNGLDMRLTWPVGAHFVAGVSAENLSWHSPPQANGFMSFWKANCEDLCPQSCCEISVPRSPNDSHVKPGASQAQKSWRHRQALAQKGWILASAATEAGLCVSTCQGKTNTIWHWFAFEFRCMPWQDWVRHFGLVSAQPSSSQTCPECHHQFWAPSQLPTSSARRIAPCRELTQEQLSKGFQVIMKYTTVCCST